MKWLAICAAAVLMATAAVMESGALKADAPKADAPKAQEHAGVCGTNPTDWCAAPQGDACGRHRDAASCRGDTACYGMPYRGESLVACSLDERGFSTNCPTVGCIGRPPNSMRK